MANLDEASMYMRDPYTGRKHTVVKDGVAVKDHWRYDKLSTNRYFIRKGTKVDDRGFPLNKDDYLNEETLNESSLTKDEVELEDGYLEWGWEKPNSYYVEKGFWEDDDHFFARTDFKRYYASPEAAEKAFNRYKKKFMSEALNEDDEYEDDLIGDILVCPNCGADLEWKGSQGSFGEEYYCPECKEYFYLDDENNLLHGDEVKFEADIVSNDIDPDQVYTIGEAIKEGSNIEKLKAFYGPKFREKE